MHSSATNWGGGFCFLAAFTLAIPLPAVAQVDPLGNVVDVLKMLTEQTNTHKESAVMSLGMKTNAEIDRALVDQILDAFTLRHIKRHFVTYLIKKGYIANGAAIGHQEFDKPQSQ